MWSFEIYKDEKLAFVLNAGGALMLNERFELMLEQNPKEEEKRFILSASDPRFSKIQSATISPLSGAKYAMNGEEEEKITHLGTCEQMRLRKGGPIGKKIIICQSNPKKKIWLIRRNGRSATICQFISSIDSIGNHDNLEIWKTSFRSNPKRIVYHLDANPIGPPCSRVFNVCSKVN